jgi:hypothetical protein
MEAQVFPKNWNNIPTPGGEIPEDVIEWSLYLRVYLKKK